MLRKVTLHGELAIKYTPSIEVYASSIQQAMSIINSNFQGFSKHIMGYSPGFHVRIGNIYKDNDSVQEPLGSSTEVHIIPAITGSGGDNGMLAIVLGAMILIFAPYLAPYMSGYTAGVGGASATYTAGSMAAGFMSFSGSLGVALILQGVSSLLFSPDKIDTKETPSNTNFNGPVNTIRQGHPVPVGYGTLMVGSALISGGIEALPKE